MRKKILSLLTTFCMVVALVATSNLPVFALNRDDTQTVTVNGLEEGTTVRAYKAIDLNVSDSGSIMDPTYTWDSDVASWVKDNHADYIGTNNEVTAKFTKLGKDEAKTFWQALGKHIKGNENSFTADKDATVEVGQNSVELTLGMGEYVLLANGGTKKIYLPAAVAVLPKKNESGDFELEPKATVTMKSEDITITKDVPNKDDQTIGVGDVVHYEVKNTIPNYPQNVDADSIKYEIGDNMSEGLTYNNDVKVLVDGQPVEALGNYEIRTNDGENDFVVAFTQEFVLAHPEGEITLQYSATVNEKAVNENALDNTVTLNYTRDPYKEDSYGTTTDKETVYTYNIEFDKVNLNDTPLAGAEFVLYQADGKTKINLVQLSDGVYRLAKQGEASVTTLTSTTGKFEVKGLDTGTYVLEETKSPNGYVLPADSKVTITLTDAEPDGALDKDTTTAESSGITVQEPSVDTKLSFSFDVVNKTAEELELPVTGGSGIMMFTVGGAILMGGAVLLYMNNRRKSHAK